MAARIAHARLMPSRRSLVCLVWFASCARAPAAEGTRFVSFWNASAANPPLAYASPGDVVALLERAGVSGSSLESGSREQHKGIPGSEPALRTALGADVVARLQALAASVTPALPWESLAFFHRHQYKAQTHEYLKPEEVSTPPHKPRRVADVLYYGPDLRPDWNGSLPRDATVLDVGCGSGRNGLFFVDYLEPARYYGFDSDAFSIESFVQLELGVLYPQLLAKRPTLRLERDWNVADVLGGARADVVLFASVLKKGLPGDTRTDVLRRVRAALAPGGLVFVFADCDGDLRERAAAAGLALRLSRHHGDCVFVDDG